MRAHRPPHRSAVTRPTRGPRPARHPRRHPARVYWVRRLLALTVVAAVVVGLVALGRLATGLTDGDADRATSAAAEPAETTESPVSPGESAAPESGAAEASRGPETRGRSQPGKRRTQKPPPAEPDGPCVEEDVVVTPSVGRAVGGGRIRIRLDLTTIESEACTWVVSPETVTMRITRDEQEIWTSRHCPGALPRQDVVVRQDRRTRVRVDWSGRLSDEECSRLTGWALPGEYLVEAAAFAGEPRDATFEITRPERPVVTRTAEPEQDGGQ